MTDLERMAREAGGTIVQSTCEWAGLMAFTAAELARFADLIRADERERCAKVCETTASQHYASARTSATDYLPVQFRAAAEALTNAAAAIRAGR
jgi:hypothetical protein